MNLSLVLLVAALLPSAVLSADPVSAPTCGDTAPLPPCNVWASRTPVGPANEIHVAVSPVDSDHVLVVAKDYGLGGSSLCANGGQNHVASAFYMTRDGGATWTVGRVPAPYPNGGAQNSPLPWGCGSDPVALFGPDGTAYYVLLNFKYTGGRQAVIAVARSSDGGATWPAEDIRILHASGGDDKEWATVDKDGRVHVAWTDLNTGRILHSRSDATWNFSAPNTLAFAESGNPAVVTASDAGGTVFVAWRDGSAIRLAKSTDHGETFGAVATAFTVTPYESGGPPRLPFMPQLAVDDDAASPHAGRIYVVWPDARIGGSSVFVAYSDGGAVWSPALRIDDRPVPATRAVMPTVDVAPGGRVDVAWLDERDNPPGAARTWRAYSASSMDGGATWSTDRAVSEVPLVTEWSHHQNGQVFIGDYIGIASTPEHAWVAFPGNGVDRLLAGLGPGEFDRSDAYLAAVSPVLPSSAPSGGATIGGAGVPQTAPSGPTFHLD